jgi:phage terminase large subunit
VSTALAVDPVKLAEYAFRHDHWETPGRILRAVSEPFSKVAVKSCHASGKTFTAADAVLLALLLGGDVITTAPTDDQVEGQIWRAVHTAMRDGQIPISEWGHVTLKEIKLSTGERAFGRSTNQGVRFQGEHARPGSFLLIVTDEAPGLMPEIYDAIEGIRAGGDVRLLFLGNPIVASGPFYEIFAGDRIGWNRETISAFDTPNLRGLTIDDVLAMSPEELDTNERPYLITRRYVHEKWHEWGPDHPKYQARVLGAFPLQSDDALISLAWLEAAGYRETAYDPKRGPLAAGIDVAGPGEDETAAWIVQHGAILDEAAFSQADARGEVLAFLKPWLHQGLVKVNVDSAGMGYYFAQHLCDMLPESVTVNAINVGERPTSDKAAELFVNLKAELYWGLRERFREGAVSGLTDQTTIAQLAAIRYEHDSRGRVVIETKEKARKRGVRSPDRAEALMLAYAPDDPSEMIAKAYAASTTKPNDREAFFAARRARHRERGRA